jgi:hypothetical protein
MTAYIDFDGVLVNSEPAHLLSYQRVLGELGVDLSPQDFQTLYMGRSEGDIIAKMRARYGFSLDQGDFSRRRCEIVLSLLDQDYFRPNLPIMNFIGREFAEQHKAVLSSQAGWLIRRCLESGGFPEFDEILSAPDLGMTKLEVARSRLTAEDWVVDDDSAFLEAVRGLAQRLVYVRHDLNGPAPPGAQILDSRHAHG